MPVNTGNNTWRNFDRFSINGTLYIRQKANDTDPINFVMADYDSDIISDIYNKKVEIKTDGAMLWCVCEK